MIIIKTPSFNNLSEHTTGWYRSDVFLVYKFHPFQCTRDEMYVLYHKVEASFEHFHLSHFCTKIAENSNDHQKKKNRNNRKLDTRRKHVKQEIWTVGKHVHNNVIVLYIFTVEYYKFIIMPVIVSTSFYM